MSSARGRLIFYCLLCLTALLVGCQGPAAVSSNQQPVGAANDGSAPVINARGVVNAASFVSANGGEGAIAQGSLFSIFGANLGPEPSQSQTAYPLATTLADVHVTVSQGSISVAAIPLFVSRSQINAVMPSNAPMGAVEVTVTYNDLTSAPVPVQVRANSFGAFAVVGGRGPAIVQNFVSERELPLNSATRPAAPSDAAILWGTGLGSLLNGATDTQPPSSGSLPARVKVLVGNIPAQTFYSGRASGLAGVDQINFVVPGNAPQGCYVPIQVIVAGRASNTVTMAIAPNRQPCSDNNPFETINRTGSKTGTIGLVRLNVTDRSDPSFGGIGDFGLAVFSEKQEGDNLAFNMYSALPPMNTCTSYSHIDDLGGLLGGQLPVAGTHGLDAGSTIIITGSEGARRFSYAKSSAPASPYLGMLGVSGVFDPRNSFPHRTGSLGLAPDPPLLNPGAYMISGPAGKDIGPFSFSISILPAAIWTNRDKISTIDRGQNLTIAWSGGDPAKQAALISGFASIPGSSGSFVCLATLEKGGFEIPASVMSSLPATVGAGQPAVISALLFATVPQGNEVVNFNTIAAPRLDSGLGYYAIIDLSNNVVFK